MDRSDVEDFVNSEPVPTVTPSLTTFYFPETPNNTKAAGLDYSIEGGIHGYGDFSEIDLRKHTLEKFLSGESPYVAAAMEGDPTGNEYNMNVNGHNVLVKHVDKGEAIGKGHVDIATENPELARSGTERTPIDIKDFIQNGKLEPFQVVPDTQGRSVNPQAVMQGAPEEPAQPEQPKKPGIEMPSLDRTPVPQVSLNVPNVPMSQIPIGGSQQPTSIAPIPGPAPTPAGTPLPSTLDKPLASEDQARIGLRSAVGALKMMYPVAGQQLDQLTQRFPQVAQGIEDSATKTLQGVTAPTTALAAPVFAVPFAAEAWGAYQLSKTPQALAGVADVVKRYGLNSRESSDAITGEVTRLAMAGTALHRPLLSMAREVTGAPAFAGKVNVAGSAINPYSKAPDSLMGFSKEGNYQKGFDESNFKYEQPVKVTFEDGEVHHDVIKGLNKAHALERARRNWPGAKIEESSFGSAGITRAGEAGSVPLPSQKRVRPVGGVKGSGRYADVYEINKEAGDKMNALAASPESAALAASTSALRVIGNLKPKEIADLGKYLVSERLLSVNPDHPQILSRAEASRIAHDPRIAAAIERYARDVKPEIEALRVRAGLPPQAAAGKSRTFISLVPKTDELLPGSPPPSARSLRYKSKTTTHAKKAEGFAKEYETDLPKILERSYGEVMRKARFRDLYDTLKRNGLTSSKPVTEIKGQRAVPVDIGRAAGTEAATGLPDTAYMPTQIADAIKDIMEKPPQIRSPVLDALSRASQKTTTAALAINQAVLVNHMRRQLEVVAAEPAATSSIGVRALQNLIPYFGPKFGTAIEAFTRDASSPEFRAVLQEIFDANAGSVRPFRKYESTSWLARKTGLTPLQKATHELLFGVPKGRGVVGWDLRLRVQMEMIRKAEEPGFEHDPQRIREFSNQLGQYSSKPSVLIEKAGKIAPFSATSFPLRGTELKQLIGTSGLKPRSGLAAARIRAETLWRGAGGFVITLAAANHILSGKWPWENDAGHKFDLATGQYDAKGKSIYWKTNWLSPTIGRPVAALSLRELDRERTAQNPNYAGAAAIGPLNQLSSMVSSPLSNVAWTLGTSGTVPYLTKHPGQRVPHFLDIASHGPTTDRGMNTLLAAIGGINPAGQAALNYVERRQNEKRGPDIPEDANIVGGDTVQPNVVEPNVVQ